MKEDEQVPALDVFTPGQPKWIIVLVHDLWVCGLRIEHDDQVRCVQCIKQEKEAVETTSRI